MKWKAIAIGTVALFVLWSVLDFVIHGVLLRDLYASGPALFRPMEEMRMSLLYLTVLIGAGAYTLLYGLNAPRPALRDSIVFGLVFGVATGFGMGFGTYSIIPIELGMAWGWFLGTLAESTLAAVVLHWVFQRGRG